MLSYAHHILDSDLKEHACSPSLHTAAAEAQSANIKHTNGASEINLRYPLIIEWHV